MQSFSFRESTYSAETDTWETHEWKDIQIAKTHFSEGENRCAFHALINNEKFVVKKYKRTNCAYFDVKAQSVASIVARRIFTSKPIKINPLSIIRLSDGGGLCLLEPFIEGEFRKFNSNSGWYDRRYETPGTFCHLSWLMTGGQMILCDIQGFLNADGYIFTDVGMFTEKNIFTIEGFTIKVPVMEMNGGKHIMDWLGHHRCGQMCYQNRLSVETSPVVSRSSSLSSRVPAEAIVPSIPIIEFQTISRNVGQLTLTGPISEETKRKAFEAAAMAAAAIIESAAMEVVGVMDDPFASLLM